MKFSTIEDLQSLIDNEIEESTVLEYKSTINKQKPNWKEELAKDVSAMANANGGIIVYGISQKENNGHSIPDKLTPISNAVMSKDSLSQLLSSNIQPVIENIEITYIPYDKHSGFFVIEVPQGITAHQNRLSHLYHRRRNATIEPMEDYEIRDVMNRTKHPVIELEFELLKTTKHVTEKPLRLLNPQAWLSDDKHYDEIDYELQYRLVNKGIVYAKYINYFIYIPVDVIPDKEKEDGDLDINGNYYVFTGNNTVRDVTAINGLNHELGPARYNPLLPNTKGKTKYISLCVEEVEEDDEDKSLPPILYVVMADNAPIKKGKVEWSNLKIIKKNKSITRDPNNMGYNIPSM